MKAVKGRELHIGQPVEVYYNLHKQVFSVLDRSTGLVVAHAPAILLSDVRFKIAEYGRQRVLRERKKNVHAFVTGTYVGQAPPNTYMRSGYYNPYMHSTFVDKQSGAALHTAEMVYLFDKQIFYKG